MCRSTAKSSCDRASVTDWSAPTGAEHARSEGDLQAIANDTTHIPSVCTLLSTTYLNPHYATSVALPQVLSPGQCRGQQVLATDDEMGGYLGSTGCC